MVDSVVNDLLYGNNARSMQFALSYWDGAYNRISGNSQGSPDQRPAMISTIRKLRDLSLSLINSANIPTPGNIDYTNSTALSGNFDYDGFTGNASDQLFNEPVSNMQPSAVVSKCIKYR